MAKLLRKALGLFVEFADDDAETSETGTSNTPPTNQSNSVNTKVYSPSSGFQMHNDDIEKFEAHFEQIMDQANLPGPDYYEFCKMMETLEAAVPDEATRIAAVYATLSVQGLTKDTLVNSANKYKVILDQDKQNFDKALTDKAGEEVESKRKLSADLKKKITDNSALIQKLTAEISDAQEQITKLNQEIGEGEAKLQNNKRGYALAYQAMMNKITVDINKIQNSIK